MKQTKHITLRQIIIEEKDLHKKNENQLQFKQLKIKKIIKTIKTNYTL